MVGSRPLLGYGSGGAKHNCTIPIVAKIFAELVFVDSRGCAGDWPFLYARTGADGSTLRRVPRLCYDRIVPVASGRDAAFDDMKTHGFLPGKFMPPHAGHLYCAEVGKARCDVMTVLVCSHDAEPIDGYLRAKWRRECLSRPGYRVLHMHRDIPQVTEDHHDFWPIWRAAITEFHPEPIDWVFGSEGYVHRLAQEVDARPFPVDPERQVVPVSATAIREDLTSNWSHVPVPERNHYQRRLGLVGADARAKIGSRQTSRRSWRATKRWPIR